nr:hypothetical protein CFP56_71103 [Quercus suber]
MLLLFGDVDTRNHSARSWKCCRANNYFQLITSCCAQTHPGMQGRLMYPHRLERVVDTLINGTRSDRCTTWRFAHDSAYFTSAPTVFFTQNYSLSGGAYCKVGSLFTFGSLAPRAPFTCPVNIVQSENAHLVSASNE